MDDRKFLVRQGPLLILAVICCCAAVPPLAAQTMTAGTPAPTSVTRSASLSSSLPAWATEGGAPQQSAQLAPARRALTDTQRRAVKWGAAAGAVAGLVFGIAAVNDCIGLACVAAPMPVILGTLAGGVIGAGVGFIAGTIIEERRDPLVYVGLAIALP